jgi:D-alanine-D-alanine ligase
LLGRATSLTGTAWRVSAAFRAASANIAIPPSSNRTRRETTILIGIAYDLKTDYADLAPETGPDDRFEEYDSFETVDAIAAALRECGHDPVLLGGGRAFLQHLLEQPIDLVFNIAEGWGTRSREAQVPAICELLRIPCTHSDSLTLALSLDKAMTKRIVAASGVPTPAFVCIDAIDELGTTSLPAFPLMVKPTCEGSSIGIHSRSRCVNVEELQDRAACLLEHYAGTVMIERFLPGVEVTVLVMGTGPGARVVGMMEISPRSQSLDGFVYSLEVKRDYRNRVEYHVPPRLPAEVISSIGETAMRAYRALACRDIARVDIRLDAAGAASLIEVNPLPGLHPMDGDVPILCGRIGISWVQLIREIVSEAQARL